MELREALRARDDFLSIASHELRTPLTTLTLGTGELIRAADSGVAPAPAQLRKQAARLRSQAQRLERLVTMALDVSRIAQGRVRLHPEQVEVSSVVREQCERLRPEASRAGSTIELVARAPIPGRFDRARIEQIVDGLLSNAIKFGAGKPIEVRLEADRETIRLAVRDRGVGIARADQARIFERFERAVSSKLAVVGHRAAPWRDGVEGASTLTVEAVRDAYPEVYESLLQRASAFAAEGE